MNLEKDLLSLFIDHRSKLDAIVRHLPCTVHINATDDFRIIYLDPRLLKNLGFNSLKALGDSSKTLDMCHPKDLKHAKEVCIHYMKYIEEYSTYSFIQRIAYENGKYHATYTTGMYVAELGGLLQFSVDIQRIINQVGNLNQIIEDVTFVRENFHKLDQLTKAETDLLLLWLNHQEPKAIATRLSISESTVKTYKKRIFNKLQINSFIELFRYGRAFNLIEGYGINERDTDFLDAYEQGKKLLPELFGRRIGYSNPRYPGFFHIHHIEGYAVKYMDPESCIEFNATLDELRSLGTGFQKMVTHPEDIPRVNGLLHQLAISGKEGEIITFFQRIQLRPEGSDGYTLVITSVRLKLEDHTFICMTNTTDQLPAFTKKISNTLNNQFESLDSIRKYQSLTNTEKKVFKLLAKGHSVKRISKSLIRSSHTIEQHKKNIYKKLGIKKLSELIEIASIITHKPSAG